MNKKYLTMITILALAAVLSSCGLVSSAQAVAASTSVPAQAVAAPTSVPAPPATAAVPNNVPGSTTALWAGLETSLEQLYNQVNPAVVNIQVVEQIAVSPSPPLLYTRASPVLNP